MCMRNKTFTPIFWMKRLRHREAKQVAQGQAIGRSGIAQDSNPRYRCPAPVFLTTKSCLGKLRWCPSLPSCPALSEMLARSAPLPILAPKHLHTRRTHSCTLFFLVGHTCSEKVSDPPRPEGIVALQFFRELVSIYPAPPFACTPLHKSYISSSPTHPSPQ